MTFLLIAGELFLLGVAWALWVRLRRARASLERLEGRFVETRVRTEETLEELGEKVRALDGRLRALGGRRFDPETPISEALAAHPEAHQVFTLYQLKARDRSPSPPGAPRTLREAAESFGVPVEELLEKLEAAAGRGKRSLPSLPLLR